MKNTSVRTNTLPDAQNRADADKLTDFILFIQRSVILSLTTQLNKENISFPQFFLLTYLASEDYLTMTDIAKKMGHSTAATTGMIDKLEKMQLVERVHAAEDRRKIMVQITTKGADFIAEKRTDIGKKLHTILEESDKV